MTAVAIWYEESDRFLWAASDTRLSADGIIRTNSASKLYALPVVCRQMPTMTAMQPLPHFAMNFGYAFCGDSTPALMTHATATTLLSTLSALGNTNPPTLRSVASFLQRIATTIGREVAESRSSHSIGFACAVFGWCSDLGKFAIYLIEPHQQNTLVMGLEEILPSNSRTPVLLGSGSELVAAELNRLITVGDEFKRTSRLPMIAIENTIAGGQHRDVGGSISIATCSSLGFQLHQRVSPIVAGQPAATMAYNGIDLARELGSIGSYHVGLMGVA